MEMLDVTGRFATVSFNKGWVIVTAKKTGRASGMWLSNDSEWTRRQLAWLFMLNPSIKPSEIDSYTLRSVTETMREIRWQSGQQAHDEMARIYGWANPENSKPFDLDEDWVEEYYSRYRPIRRKVQSQLIEEAQQAA
jgi:hypothetical protein